MDYQNLTAESVIYYIKQKTKLFPNAAALKSYEIGINGNTADGDGFINFVFRVWDEATHRSVIVKQARDYARTFDTTRDMQMRYLPERNTIEAEILKIKYAITPEYIPEIYWVDPANHLYICEDCSNLKILRFEMMAGRAPEKVPHMIGELVAKNNFYTSELYLSPDLHQKLTAHFANPEMRNLFETILFLHDEHPLGDPHIDPKVDPIRLAMGDMPWKSHAFRTEMLKLRHIYMAKSECLIHSDLHTSNILVDDDHIKTIDMEYAFVGPCSADAGYLMGNFIYEYLRWFYIDDTDRPGTAKRMRHQSLHYIRAFLESYRKVFKDCWEKDVRATYRGFDDYCDYLLEQFFHEAIGFIGCQIMSRVGGCVRLPDFDTLSSQTDQYEACRISLIIGQYLIMHRDEIHSVSALIDTIKTLTIQSRLLFKKANAR